jgi:hypothetical protein
MEDSGTIRSSISRSRAFPKVWTYLSFHMYELSTKLFHDRETRLIMSKSFGSKAENTLSISSGGKEVSGGRLSQNISFLKYGNRYLSRFRNR